MLAFFSTKLIKLYEAWLQSNLICELKRTEGVINACPALQEWQVKLCARVNSVGSCAACLVRHGAVWNFASAALEYVIFYFPPGIMRLARATYAMDRWLGADPAGLPPRAMALSVSNRTSLLYVSPVSSPRRNVTKNQRPVSTVKHTGKIHR